MERQATNKHIAAESVHTFKVTPTDTALYQGSGSLEVLATPRLVAWFEQAACAAIAEKMNEGETTVGTHIQVEHTAPSALHSSVEVRATLTQWEGRTLHFTLEAYQGTLLVGRGDHTRVVIDAQRFMQKLSTRA